MTSEVMKQLGISSSLDTGALAERLVRWGWYTEAGNQISLRVFVEQGRALPYKLVAEQESRPRPMHEQPIKLWSGKLWSRPLGRPLTPAQV
jgi:hypothetical protein